MKKIFLGAILLVFLSIMLTGCINHSFSSSVSSAGGVISKGFGSSSSLDTKPLILKNNATYEFKVSAKIKEGSLTVTVLDENKDKVFLKIEGRDIDEKEKVDLEAGKYFVEVETHDAKDGQIRIEYGIKRNIFARILGIG